MRDFRDAKAMARTLRQALAAKGLKVSNSEALELVAKLFGARDWNALSAATAAAATPVSAPEPRPANLQRFSPALEAALHRAVAHANSRRHTSTTLEHLLLSLLDDPETVEVLVACEADVEPLRGQLTGFVDEGAGLAGGDGVSAVPTDGFHQVVRRAVIHVQSAGRPQVTGPNLLVAIFSEGESYACASLRQHGVERFDAVNFIAHGVRKDGKEA